MGSPTDEYGRGRNTEDLTTVTFTRPFLLQQTELTQGQWTAMGFPNRAGTKDDGTGGTDCLADDCPASTFTWCEAAEYANRLSAHEGRQACMKLIHPRGTVGVDFACDGLASEDASYYDCDGYRLPTSGEWEYATRAGTKTAFFSGPWIATSMDCIDLPHLSKVAWYCSNSGGRTHAVCTREPNAWGLHDLVGNAAEYVADPGQHGYGPGPVTDPPLAINRHGDTDQRLIRGSFWFASPTVLRSGDQASTVPIVTPPASATAGQGMRLARTLSAAENAAW